MTNLILVVEDDHAIATTMAMLLEAERYAVKIADSRDAALASMRSFRPDLILLDHMGEEECRDIVKMARKFEKHVPIIFVSAWSKPEEIAQKLGIEKVVAKPFAIERLLETIHEIVPAPYQKAIDSVADRVAERMRAEKGDKAAS